MRHHPGRLTGDDGSAIVEFALISVLLVFLLFGVLQVAAVLYVRSVVSSAAGDGARYGADAGVSADEGGVRASALISRSLSEGMARRIPCTGTLTSDAASGLATTTVVCRGDIDSLLIPVGIFIHVQATAQTLKEQP